MTPEDKSRQYDRRRGRGVWRKHVEVPTRVVTTDATTELSEAAIRMQIALENRRIRALEKSRFQARMRRHKIRALKLIGAEVKP